MSTRKKKKQITVRLPVDLHEFIKGRAFRKHGEDYTAAMIEVLSRAREIIVKEEGLLAEYWLQEWKKQRDKLREEKFKKENLDDVQEE